MSSLSEHRSSSSSAFDYTPVSDSSPASSTSSLTAKSVADDISLSIHSSSNTLSTDSPTSLSASVAPFTGGAATLFSCTAALANTILGAGMLGLPHAFAASGYVFGFVLLFVSAFASGFALHCLQVSARTVGVAPASFYSVAKASIPRASWLIDLAVAVKCFGVATSYLIVAGDMAVPAVKTIFGDSIPDAVADRRLWIAIVFVCIIMPLACLRSLNALRFTATASILFVIILTVLIVCYATVPSINPCSTVECEPTTAVTFSMDTLKVFSVFIFGFTCHQNIFPVYNELQNNTERRIDRVILTALAIAFSVYIGVAVGGYATFGSAVASDILNNYPSSDGLLAAARILVALNVCFCYPLQAHPCRNSCFALWFTFLEWREQTAQKKKQIQGEDREDKANTRLTEESDTHEERQRQKKKKAVSRKGYEKLNGNGLDDNEHTVEDDGEHTNNKPPKNEQSYLLENGVHPSATVVPSTARMNKSSSSARRSSDSHDSHSPVLSRTPSSLSISLLTVLITLASFAIAMVVDDLGVVLSVVGATGSTTISYILPGLVYVTLHEQWTVRKIFAAIQLVAGIIIVPSCLTFIFL